MRKLEGKTKLRITNDYFAEGKNSYAYKIEDIER